MALAYAGVSVELREIIFRNKPAAMLNASPKGTVPVLVLGNGTVIDESIDVMHWALNQDDPDAWLVAGAAADELIDRFDNEFKPILDRYKYWDRYPELTRGGYLDQAMPYLRQLDHRLNTNDYLFGDRLSLADVALFPFIRQFAFADKPTFDNLSLPQLQDWLEGLLELPLFLQIMEKHVVWNEGDPPVMTKV